MDGCLVVRLEGRSRGLAMLWRERVDVAMQNYSNHHIDSLVTMESHKRLRFTGFYGHTDSNLKGYSQEGESFNLGGTGCGGDFNTIISDAEKEGHRRKSRATMDGFYEVMEELSLVDIKIDNVKPHENFRDSRLFFKYGVCWAKEKEARDIIKRVWIENNIDILDKVERVRENLGLWQFNHYRRMKNQILGLVERIDKLVDGPNKENTTNLLKSACLKLGHLYVVEESYWAQRAHIKWLTEGDRNTRYFHVKHTLLSCVCFWQKEKEQH
ncbi:hypothetical protein GOBAR_DD09994 [Gossypium barbadense]|nr:hypothetical protein GOBAR_DD09994 [Gossypium barbadense]